MINYMTEEKGANTISLTLFLYPKIRKQSQWQSQLQ